MSTFTTALGETYTVERRLPSLGWRPRWRGSSEAADLLSVPDFGDGDGILAVIGFAVLALVAVLVLLPLLLFVGEVALVIAIVIPLTVLALAVGLVRHTVQVRKGASAGEGQVLDQCEVRGAISSWRAARELRAAAEAGAYRAQAAQAPPS